MPLQRGKGGFMQLAALQGVAAAACRDGVSSRPLVINALLASQRNLQCGACTKLCLRSWRGLLPAGTLAGQSRMQQLLQLITTLGPLDKPQLGRDAVPEVRRMLQVVPPPPCLLMLSLLQCGA